MSCSAREGLTIACHNTTNIFFSSVLNDKVGVEFPLVCGNQTVEFFTTGFRNISNFHHLYVKLIPALHRNVLERLSPLLKHLHVLCYFIAFHAIFMLNLYTLRKQAYSNILKILPPKKMKFFR